MILTFTKILAKTKITSLAFLLMFSLQFLQIANVNAQASSQQRLKSRVKITNVETINESRIGLIDGKIIVTIEDLNAPSSKYLLSYDLHSAGNNFISPLLTSVNNKLTLSNVRMGNYYNLKVIRTLDNLASAPSALFKVDNAPYIESAIASSNRTTTLCGSTINYNDCNGVSKSISNCNTGSAYNDANDYRPCGLEVAPTCTVFALAQWHCIDGGLSRPPLHQEYTPTDYIGAGLTALQAARVNWIVCNHSCFDAGVDVAIWFIVGTGGSNNAIAQAAVAAVPVANGTQTLMTFYKSLNGSYQDMVQWQCRSVLTNASIGDFVWTDTNQNGVQDAGEAGISGVTVTLKNSVGTIIDVTTTSATGAYSFVGLSSGSYTVTFTTPTGYSPSPSNVTIAGATDANDSDPVSGVVSVTLASSTEINNTIDAGFFVTPIVPVSLGNLVFDDKNRSGLYDAGDGVIAGATVRLYLDANNDNVPDGAAISTTITDANGNYTFINLNAGNYIVGVVPPVLFAITVLNGGDPDNNIDNDNNGISLVSGEVRGNSITLASGTEPDVNANNTYDIGLYNPTLPPNGGEGCFTGTNPVVYAKSFWNVNANSQTVTMRVTFAKTFVDNTYGTSIIGWPGSHSFSNLTGSDHLQWSVKNGAGVEVLAFKQDYMSASALFPSGYGNLGFGGDGGNPTAGLATDVLSFRSSLTSNFNDYGYIYTTNSPTTDANYSPNATAPNWIYEVWYEITVKASTFGASGFGFIDVASVHASPSKTGNNTEAVTNTPCPLVNVGNVVWGDQNNDGIKQSTEAGIGGVTVKLYVDANNDNLADVGATVLTTTTDANGIYNFAGLAAGNYIVGVTIPNGFATGTLNTADPDNNIDNDNNGATIIAGEIRSNSITLTVGGEPAATVDGDGTAGNLTLDFALKGTGSIGDFVFNDANANGIQDAGELGIASVTVVLTYPNGSTTSTTTDTNGNYTFANLAPGTFTITFTTPAGYNPTTANVGANDAVDSDPIAGAVTGIIITAGQLNTTIDAGFFQYVNLGNIVWSDLNNDGIKQASELGIANLSVKLYLDLNNDNLADGAVFATTTTDANGVYNFANLIPGNYIVGVVLPNGYAAVTTNGGDPDNNIDNDNNGINTIVGEVRSNTVTLTSGLEPAAGVDGDGNNGNLTVDFAFRGTGSIGDFVFNDANGNGIQDAGELGIAGATVVLTNPNGTTTPVITDANGFYSFANLAPGTYSVSFTTPAGYTPTSSNVGANDAVDSDPIGGTVSVVLTAGQINTTVDAGFYQLVNLGNTVWYDQNNDGIKQSTEIGISAVNVKLYADANNDNLADGAAIATTITDATGLYNFVNLAPGNYIVGVSIPSGYAAVATNGGDPDNDINNDNNGTNTFIVGEVRSSAVTLLSGTEPASDGDGTSGNLTLDFALKGTGVIGDFVFNDANGNGIQDAGETGIAGAMVVLTYPNGTTVATTADANGNYSFPNLAPGTYSIAFTTPNGLTASPANQGGDPTKDSNPVGGVVSGIVLTAGQLNTTIDAGFFAANVMNLGNVVWYDQNNNGTKDATETGIAGATVNLYADANNDNLADGSAIAITTTDANGVYNFGGLVPSNYITGVIIPTGYAVSSTSGSDPDNDINNDNNGTNTLVAGEVRSSAITLALTTEPTTDGDGNNGNLTLDFGFRGTGSIGDFVFNDVNGNGIQDAGEIGIAGATVVLTYPNGTTVTTTTDANGNYTFANLAPGTYSVAFTTPVGLTASPANQGGDPTKDSNPVGGVVSGLVLTAGQLNTTVDAGFYAANVMTLGNIVWYDQNNDGIKQVTETGIANATVKLYADANNDNAADGAAISTTTTDANGMYSFGGLLAGNYIVGVNIPTGYAVVTTNGGDPDNNTDNDNNGVNINAGEVRSNAITLALTTEPITDGDGNNGNLTLDFGLKGTALIGDFVFNDLNGNGIQDAGEVGLPSVTVSLLNPNGTTTTITTDVNGFYSFANLAPGTYSITFTTPSGLTASPANVGANDNIDSDPVGGTVSGIVLTAGQLNTTVDAGFFASNVMNIGNTVWYDQNNNGIKEPTENGIAGATVKLYADVNNDNIADGVAIATTTTDANGMYNFGGLAAGNYIVGVNIPAGYAVVITNGGDPDNDADNDNNGTNTNVAGEVRSSAITLALTTEPTTDGDGNNGNLTLDFGLKGTGIIGNFVFNDVNANGIQDVTETGIAGATVTLTYPNLTTVPTTTDPNGLYSFSNLAPGAYSVTFTTPAGYNVSPSNVTVPGATDANDSDPVGGIVNNIVLTAGEVNNTVDAGFFNCVALVSGIDGPAKICAGEAAVFSPTVSGGAGSVYTWTFMNGTPATATGVNVVSTWTIAGDYDVTLTITKNGCTSTFVKPILITQGIFADAGPNKDICSGSSTIINGTGPAGSTYSWYVVSGDATSIDNGAFQSSILVSPLLTTVYQLTVTQNGCSKFDTVTVFINVNRNPVADAGPNKTILLGTSVAIGGSPTGTVPVATPNATLAYSWTPIAGLSSNTATNPIVTLAVAGSTTYQVVVISNVAPNLVCTDTAITNVKAIQPVNLGNSVWYDKNNNGTKDANEPGINTTVYLYEDLNNDNVPDGAAIVTTTTVNGAYNFTNLFPGSYIVGAVIPNGYLAVATNGGNPDNNIDNDNNGSITTVPGEVRTPFITLTAGGEPTTALDGNDTNGNLTLDIALTGNGRLGNFVWEDANRNGVQDANEAGIANVTVRLTYPDGGNATATTTGTGAYSFEKLIPGSYDVEFITPVGYKATTSNVTGGSATDSNDSDPINGFVSNITIAAGDDNGTIDAGFYVPISIAGNVWHDINGLTDNLINNSGAAAIPPAQLIPVGLRAYLVNNATGLIESISFVSSLTGTFIFNDVAPNTNYYIILSSTQAIVGTTPPAANLPTGWQNVGEKLGAGPGSDGVINGRLNVPVGTVNVTDANFGIKLKSGEVIIG